tara:strand:+ start:1328 stop:1645 length:318 start_codon:yes stop_codon:yes gene_type:complete
MYSNISGATTIALLSPGSGVSNAKTIHIANTHASDAVLVDLYISTISSEGVSAVSCYVLKGYSISVKGYFNLESDILSFANTSSTGFGLFIKLNNADSEVDVIIK